MTETATEWGPARHNPEDPRSHARLTLAYDSALDDWADDGTLPEDN